MPPIPIYSQSPINGDTADGVTPKTAAVPGSGQPLRDTPATTTSASSARYAPPPAQPGAVPRLPEPTGVSYAPTATARAPQYVPPPPQPGAAPVPPRTSNAPQPPVMSPSPPQPRQTTPPTFPPPKAGETLATAMTAAKATPTPTTTTTAPAITAMPSQVGMPPLSTPYPGAARGTAAAPATTAPVPSQRYAAIPQPTGALVSHEITVDNRVLEHPPGYVQDAYATEMNSSQREAARTAQRDVSSRHDGIAVRHSSSIGDEGEGLWDAAKKLAASVGEGLKAGETEVWRRINKE